MNSWSSTGMGGESGSGRHPGSWQWLLGAIVICAWGGCGSSEIDREDELGVDDEGCRYELVIVAEQEETKGEKAPIAVEKPDTTAPIVYDPQGVFTVQIGVFRDAYTASRMVRELSAEGYPAYAIAQPDKRAVRVRIGYFATRADALRFGAIFKQDRGMDYWVDRRQNESF